MTNLVPECTSFDLSGLDYILFLHCEVIADSDWRMN